MPAVQSRVVMTYLCVLNVTLLEDLLNDLVLV
jgi:hypothetical protein